MRIVNAAHATTLGIKAGAPLGRTAAAFRLHALADCRAVRVVGGTVSEATGGSFANGAVTAAFQFLFNSAVHSSREKRQFPSFDKLKENYPRNADGTVAHPSDDEYKNQCAIRLGLDLINSGEDLSPYPRINVTTEGYPRPAKNLMDWISNTYGPPTETTYDYFYEHVSPTKQGIFAQFSYDFQTKQWSVFHIDIFYNNNFGSGFFGWRPPQPAAKIAYWEIE